MNLTPFTIAIDTREQAPWHFTEIVHRGQPLAVQTRWQTLRAGDYSIVGLEDQVAIERKSLSDLFGTVGQGRERFEREHERLAELAFAAVVIESDWPTILNSPPERSRLGPQVVFQTAVSWSVKYGVHWIPAGSRRQAELCCFHLLRKFWEER